MIAMQQVSDPTNKTLEQAAGVFDPRLLLAALGAFALGYIVLPALGALVGHWGGKAPWATFLGGLPVVIGPLVSVAAVLGLTWNFCGSFRKAWQLLGFKQFPVRMLWYAFPLAFLLMAAGGAVTLLWNWAGEACNFKFTVPPTVEAALSGNSWCLTALLVTALLAAPFFEEILFRRALYGALRQFLPGAAAGALAALAFAAMHMSLLQLPGLWLIGGVWQLIYCRSDNLYKSVILHFFNNVIAAIMLLLVRYAGLEATILSL